MHGCGRGVCWTPWPVCRGIRSWHPDSAPGGAGGIPNPTVGMGQVLDEFLGGSRLHFQRGFGGGEGLWTTLQIRPSVDMFVKAAFEDLFPQEASNIDLVLEDAPVHVAERIGIRLGE